MKLRQTIILSLCIFFLVVGVHQTTMHGFAHSYWIFMLMFIFWIFFQLGKSKKETTDNDKESESEVYIAQKIPGKKRKRVKNKQKPSNNTGNEK